jgi:hypothetical protein
MLRLSALACLAATAASLTTFRPLSRGPLSRGPLGRGQQSANPPAQQHLDARASTRLRAAWEPQVDGASGQTYYVNSMTGESLWELPPPASTKWNIDCYNGVAGFSGVAGFMADNKFGDREFRMEYEREGRPCQLPYQIGSGEEKMLSRWNMIDQKLTVSRGQALIRCKADGTAVLSSEGDSPTLWRAPGGQWNSLYKDQETIISDGDQVSLDCNDPEGAVFVCYAEAGGGGQDAGWVAQVDEASGQTVSGWDGASLVA